MQPPFSAADVSVVIPTYRRGRVLLDTLQACLDQRPLPAEILVIDQTPCHDPETDATLRRWGQAGRIRLLRRGQPSQPAAMNAGLCSATRPLVLFLDDDVVPCDDLVQQHAAAHGDPNTWAVVGQILQPGQVPIEGQASDPDGRLTTHLDFSFNSSRPAWIENCMSGNLSVRRERAMAVGGFDENFCYTVAYRFDTEFGRRLRRHGGKIVFEPAASLRHLRADCGGTRTTLDHRRSHRPDHAIGDYYFALLHGVGPETLWYMTRRLLRSVITRYHLRHPWWIAPKLVGEIRGLWGAIRLAAQGQRLLGRADIPIVQEGRSHAVPRGTDTR